MPKRPAGTVGVADASHPGRKRRSPLIRIDAGRESDVPDLIASDHDRIVGKTFRKNFMHHPGKPQMPTAEIRKRPSPPLPKPDVSQPARQTRAPKPQFAERHPGMAGHNGNGKGRVPDAKPEGSMVNHLRRMSQPLQRGLQRLSLQNGSVVANPCESENADVHFPTPRTIVTILPRTR